MHVYTRVDVRRCMYGRLRACVSAFVMFVCAVPLRELRVEIGDASPLSKLVTRCHCRNWSTERISIIIIIIADSFFYMQSETC